MRHIIISLMVAVAAIISFGAFAPAAQAADPAFRAACMAIPVFAHRGSFGSQDGHVGPNENTIESFDRTVRFGGSGIEVDLRPAKNGIVLSHDTTLNRTTRRRGLIRNISVERYTKIRTNAGNYLVSFERLLVWLKAHPSVVAQVEGKFGGWAPFHYRQLAELVRRYDAQNQIIWISAEQRWLGAVHRHLPDMQYGRVGFNADQPRLASVPAWTQWVMIGYRAAFGRYGSHRTYMDALKAAGKRASVRFHDATRAGDNVRTWRREIRAGADSIVTDRLRAFRKSKVCR